MRLFLVLLIFFFTDKISSKNLDDILEYFSPQKKISVRFFLESDKLMYSVKFNERLVLGKSKLDMVLKIDKFFAEKNNAKSKNDYSKNKSLLGRGYKLKKITSSLFYHKWKPVLGEVKEIEDIHNKIVLNLESKDSINCNVIFKIFDDGIGFRYEFPKQDKLDFFIVLDEYSEFNLLDNYTAWWQSGNYNSNENVIHQTSLSSIDGFLECKSNILFVPVGCNSNLVQTPLMLRSPDSNIYVNIHEAALVNYPAMQLMLNKKTNTFISDLVPDALGNKAYLESPFSTPWRTVIISDNAKDIVSSKIILNLNDSCIIEDISWIRPVKYIGIWWEMFVGRGTWNYYDPKSYKPVLNHSANTNNVKGYIDFASKHNFDGVLVEGWNTGWENWFGKWRDEIFDFVTPYPDFDVAELQKYAKSKGVYLIMHNETSGSAASYERQLDTAYKFMNNHGYPAVKIGYVGSIVPRGENHDGQWMVNHYLRVAKKAVKHKIMINVHEPVRPTGLHRTYPNWLACEAARGMEYNAWDNGNKIDHDLNLIFTRLIGGPMDYTPGIFKLKLDYLPNKKEIVHSTLARQLALYVVMYSPIQMAADLPENYENKLDAFQFIKDVPADWDDTKVLEAEPGDYITIIRRGKNTNNWFLGSITDENSRHLKIKLDFLDPNKNYEATIYRDAPDTEVNISPEKYVIEKKYVNSNGVIDLIIKEAGGVAVSFFEIKN